MDILTNINLAKNELQNARIQNLVVPPANPADGQVYYHATDKTIYMYNGAAWVDLGLIFANKTVLDAITAAFTTELKIKLDGIEAGANKYTHPATHPASMITESTTKRFVSDTEKAAWNGKAEPSDVSTALNTAKSYTDTQVAGIVDSAPEALDTLQELATALGNDPNFATTIISEIGTKETPSGAQSKADAAESNAKAYTDAHDGNTTKHITSAERTTWNARTKKYTANIGNGTATEFTVTHGLGTKDLALGIEEVATGEMVFTDVQKIDTNSIKLLFAQPPASNQYRLTVVG